MNIWKPGKLLTLPHTEAMHAATEGNGITIKNIPLLAASLVKKSCVIMYLRIWYNRHYIKNERNL